MSGAEFVEGGVTSREEAQEMLDAYQIDHYVSKLTFEPGQTLHVYMATGSNVHNFDEHFKSSDVPHQEWMEDMFIISTTPLDVDPELVDEADWKWPERYEKSAGISPEL